jgi:hypothetical protein
MTIIAKLLIIKISLLCVADNIVLREKSATVYPLNYQGDFDSFNDSDFRKF